MVGAETRAPEHTEPSRRPQQQQRGCRVCTARGAFGSGQAVPTESRASWPSPLCSHCADVACAPGSDYLASIARKSRSVRTLVRSENKSEPGADRIGADQSLRRPGRVVPQSWDRSPPADVFPLAQRDRSLCAWTKNSKRLPERSAGLSSLWWSREGACSELLVVLASARSKQILLSAPAGIWVRYSVKNRAGSVEVGCSDMLGRLADTALKCFLLVRVPLGL